MTSSAAPPPSTPDAAADRSRLLGIKLAALVREHLGRSVDVEPHTFARGAALRADDAGWVLLDGEPAGSLGAALAWAVRGEVSRLHLLADEATGLLARRAAQFSLPIEVWHVDDRRLLPAVAEPFAAVPQPPPGHLALRSVIEAAGATPMVEHGVVFGEVRGLEVCRVVDRPDGEEAALEVGVGAHDREAFGMLHGDVPTLEALASVVGHVVEHRTVDAPHHPLNGLARERFLRWRIESEPTLAGADIVVPGEPPVARPNVGDAVPCTATATRGSESEWSLVCTAGVDLEVVPFTADVIAAGGRAEIVMPERDLLPITRDLAALLAQPVALRTVA